VVSHHYGWGSPGLYDASKWWSSALQTNTQMPCCQSVATASTRSRLCFVEWKLLRQVVRYSLGHFLLYIMICATFLLAYKTFCSYLWMVCTHSTTTCSCFRDEAHETALLFDLFSTLQVLPLTELHYSITHFNIFHSYELIASSYVSICGNKL
jgi:hypothetical protein